MKSGPKSRSNILGNAVCPHVYSYLSIRLVDRQEAHCDKLRNMATSTVHIVRRKKNPHKLDYEIMVMMGKRAASTQVKFACFHQSPPPIASHRFGSIQLPFERVGGNWSRSSASRIFAVSWEMKNQFCKFIEMAMSLSHAAQL